MTTSREYSASVFCKVIVEYCLCLLNTAYKPPGEPAFALPFVVLMRQQFEPHFMERIRTHPIRNFRDFYRACRLAHDQYCRQKYMTPSPSGIRIFLKELLPSSVMFVAILDDEMIGTVTLIKNTKGGLPASGQYQNEIDELAAEGRVVAEGTKMASIGASFGVPKTPGAPSYVARELIRWLIDWCRKMNYDDFLALPHPSHLPFWVGMLGFEKIGGLKPCGHVQGSPGILLRLPIASLDRKETSFTDEGRDFFFGPRPSQQDLEPYKLRSAELAFVIAEHPSLAQESSTNEMEAFVEAYPELYKMAREVFENHRASGKSYEPFISLVPFFARMLGLDEIALPVGEVRPKAIQLRLFLSKLVLVLRAEAASRSLGFEFKVDDRVPDSVVCDPQLFGRVVTEILESAIHSASRGNSGIALNVGIGFRQGLRYELRLKLISLLERVSPDVKNLLALMGGRVVAEQHLGDMCEISLSLPMLMHERNISNTLTHDEMEESRPMDQMLVFNSMRILVVEDNLVSRRIITRYLERSGATVTAVEDGRQALSRLSQDYFDIILLDCQMPVMDGFETARSIRSSSNDYIRDVPIIALTAFTMEGDRERCLEAGMNDYLAKPVPTSLLRKKILQLVENKSHDIAEPVFERVSNF